MKFRKRYLCRCDRLKDKQVTCEFRLDAENKSTAKGFQIFFGHHI